MKRAIGIDLGTTNSCASYYKYVEGQHSGAPIVIPMNGNPTLPSCVSLVNGEYVVGEESYKQRYLPNTIYSVKRAMGVKEEVSLTDSVTGETRTLHPKEVSSIILRSMRETIIKDFGSVDQVTITVPAYFTALQKQLTQEAGILAGFKEVSIINEPTAASLAYQLETTDKTETVLVFDLGGGTFDVAVCELIPKTDDLPNEEEDIFGSFYGLDEEQKHLHTQL